MAEVLWIKVNVFKSRPKNIPVGIDRTKNECDRQTDRQTDRMTVAYAALAHSARRAVKAKFHYASLFGAGSELAPNRFGAC